MWRHVGTRNWSCSSAPTDYVNSHASGLKSPTTEITGHSSHHKISGLLSSMSWRFYGRSSNGPCGCRNGIPLLCITSLQSDNDMFDHMDGVMRALAKKKTPWKEDLFFAVKFARQTLSKYYTEVTPTTGMLLISTHIRDPLRKRRSFRKWDMGMDSNPEDKTSYTTQYQEAFLKYVENEYCGKHRHFPVTKSENIQNTNPSFSAMASKSGQSSYDPYDLSSNDEEYLIPNNVAETTPGRSNCAARLLTATRLYLNSPPEIPQNSGQIHPNLNDYHSDPMEMSRTYWLPDITDWWRQQRETHSKYANLSKVARDIFSIIPHGV